MVFLQGKKIIKGANKESGEKKGNKQGDMETGEKNSYSPNKSHINN